MKGRRGLSRKRKQPRDLSAQLLDLVHSANLAVNSSGVLDTLLQGARTLVPCDGVSVLWLDKGHLSVLKSYGPTASLEGLTLPAIQMGAAQPLLDSGRPVLVDDTTDDERWRRVPSQTPARSWLGVPLSFGDQVVGLVEWTARDQEHFAEDDVQTAVQVARCFAPLLHRARLLDDTRDRLREAAEQRSAAARPEIDLAAELEPVVREARDFTSAKDAFVYVLVDQEDRMHCLAASGEREEKLLRTSLQGDGTLGDWAAPGVRSQVWRGIGPSDREVMAVLGIERVLILPLRAGGRQVGVLGVAEPSRGRFFGRDCVRIMTHLASQASVILERHRRPKRKPNGFDYAMVMRSSPLGVAVVTPVGDILAWNPALSTTLSVSARSTSGQNLAEFLTPGDRQRLRLALEEVAITGQRRQVEARLESRAGNQRHVRISLAHSGAAGGNEGNIVTIVEDITSLKILEQERVEHLRELGEKHEQLRDLDRLRTRFVSNVSHELRTPLAVIKLYATLARHGRPERRGFYLQTIEQETLRLETMVENILDVTRMDRGTLQLEPEMLAADEIIAQVLEVYRERAEQKGIKLRNRIRGGLPTLWADRNHLVQMLTNLVDNALKYTPRGGQVWVAARRTKSTSREFLEIDVGDTGEGIPEDEQDKIFERFYRGKSAMPGSTGTGLGLAIVRELVERHGGEVMLNSRVGTGSVFRLRFPLDVSAASQQKAADTEEHDEE
jgi:PAS domain S-box-containing protein